jgi:hypothetical protein
VAIKDPDADEGETMTRGGAAFFGGIVGLLLGIH